MKKFKVLLIVLIVGIFGIFAMGSGEEEGTSSTKVKAPIASSDAVGKDLNEIKQILTNAGFENITCFEEADLLESEQDQVDKIISLKIGGYTMYSGDSYKTDASIVIHYHTVNYTNKGAGKVQLTQAPSDFVYKDKSYAYNYFKNLGFTNISYEKITDLIIGFLTKDGEVDKITVGGQSSCKKGDWVDPSAKVIIYYHTFPDSEDNPSGGGSQVDPKDIIIDYNSEADFEADLNLGKNLVNKVVKIVVQNIEPNSAYGYNIWAGEHLNFCSTENQNAKVGDGLIVKVTEVKTVLKSYIIKYEKLGTYDPSQENPSGGGQSVETGIEMPDLIGLTESEAKDKLNKLGFKNVKTSRESIAKRTGTIDDSFWVVSEQSIEKESKIEANTEISIKSSLSTITVSNNDEFNELVKLSSPSDEKIKDFATKYKGKIIEFEGCVSLIQSYPNTQYSYNFYFSYGPYKSGIINNSPRFYVERQVTSGMYINFSDGTSTLIESKNCHLYFKVKGYNEDNYSIEVSPICIKDGENDISQELEAKFPKTTAIKVIRVALMNGISPDTNTEGVYNSSLFHKISEISMYNMSLYYSGVWVPTDENTWYVSDLYLVSSVGVYARLNAEIKYDGTNYIVKSMSGWLDTDLDSLEDGISTSNTRMFVNTYDGTNTSSFLLVTPDLLK